MAGNLLYLRLLLVILGVTGGNTAENVSCGLGCCRENSCLML